MRRLVVALLVTSATACSLAHERDVDAGLARDAATRDATDETCPQIGGYRACGPICIEECPADSRCREYLSVCLPNLPAPFEDPRGPAVCAREENPRGRTATERYCWDGQLCAIDPETFDRSVWGYRCVSADYCREAAALGIEAPCYYSDHTWFEGGPPVVDSCPVPADPLTPFCGGPCGDCPYHGLTERPPLDYDISCVGISERRGFGVCTFGLKWGCREDAPMGSDCEGIYGRPCACMMLRGAEGEELERGWVTFESACLAYRATDPEGVVCRNPRTWEALEE